LILASTLTFLTPRGALLALLTLLPLAALLVTSLRNSRGRARLGLAAPIRDRTVIAVTLVPLLVGLAAAQPAIESHVPQRYRTHAQALFVFDVSGSMDASHGPKALDRLQEAQKDAIRLRNSIADVPSGVVSLTTQVLPELLPTTDAATFDSTVDQVIGIEEPPPPTLSYGVLGTSFGPLSYIRSDGYFAPSAKKRLIVLLTDGESAPYDPQATAAALTRLAPVYSFSGVASEPDPPISLVIVRVGGPSDRIYMSNGEIDAAYRPEPRANDIVDGFASLTNGGAYTSSSLGQASHRIRQLLGKGEEIQQGTRTQTITLTRYIALAALLAAGFVLWRRNLKPA
jgi:hypothetical protein